MGSFGKRARSWVFFGAAVEVIAPVACSSDSTPPGREPQAAGESGTSAGVGEPGGEHTVIAGAGNGGSENSAGETQGGAGQGQGGMEPVNQGGEIGEGGSAGEPTVGPKFPKYPTVTFPKENPFSTERAMLGKILFWDEQLSSDDTMACG